MPPGGFSCGSVKYPAAVQETRVQSLGGEDLLEKGKATHSSILGPSLWLSWERIHLQCRRPRFDPWVGRSLEKGMDTHSSILTWRIPCTVQSTGSQRVDMTERLSLSSPGSPFPSSLPLPLPPSPPASSLLHPSVASRTCGAVLKSCSAARFSHPTLHHGASLALRDTHSTVGGLLLPTCMT